MDKDIYIIGAGTYGEAMFELALLCGYNPVAYFDDDENKLGQKVMDIPILGKLDSAKFSIAGENFVVAIGNNKIREKKMLELINLDANVPSLIHPSANISKYAKISNIGCYIHANVYIWTKVRIEKFCIVSPVVMIAHHSVLKEGCFISAGSNIGAGIILDDKSFIGIGSTIMTGVKKIGKNTIVGAGSVIIKNIADNHIVVGNPGRIIKK